MGKSVYSLVLADDVVAAVDRMAYSAHTSRSGLINQILAEHLSCVTPEKRNRSIFEAVEKRMEQEMYRLQVMPSESILSIHSAMTYKYNPHIRYAVELHHGSEGITGLLKAGFRTQNQTLIRTLDEFLKVWMRFEQRYIGSYFKGGKIHCQAENGKYLRSFISSDKFERLEDYGVAIAEYVHMMDGILKFYFSLIDSPVLLDEMEKEFLYRLRSREFII